MAAPVLANVALADDSANSANKKMQTQSESISGTTVHAHYFIPRSKRKILGQYKIASSLQSTVQTAHDGTSTGFVWLQLPAASAVHARLRRLELAFTCITESDHLTAPRVVLARGTFTGTASGAEVSPALRMTGDASAIAHWRTAVTGMTVTVGNGVWTAPNPALLVTTSGIVFPAYQALWAPTDEEDYLDLASGELALLYQPDTGTATDGRRFTIVGEWDEYDSA